MKFALTVVAFVLLVPSAAYAEARVERVVFSGLARTRAGTLLSLLPRLPPATLSDAEVAEFERRINNLGIFDAVAVSYDGVHGWLMVDVREKFSLTPSADFSSGQTLEDSYILLGLTEYNLFGAAATLSGSASLEQRGLNGELYFAEHAYAARRFTVSGEVYYGSASLRFDSGENWYRDHAGVEVSLRPPYYYGTPFRYQISANAVRETVSVIDGTFAPPSGTELTTELEINWDRYTWRDLSASGVSVGVVGATGGLFPASQPRHSAEATIIGAVAPTETTAIMLRLRGRVGTTGNANFSGLLGSLEGVRGLDDSFYRNHWHSFANLEVRQAWRFAARWALQAVAFTDGAVFRPMGAHGEPLGVTSAASAGGGIRLIPTFLTQLLVRLDAGSLLYPDTRFFVQFGLNQYF